MPFRFHKSIKIAPGFRLNLSKSGVSGSVGPRGAKVNVGRRGVRATASIPGSGLSFSQKIGGPTRRGSRSGTGCGCLPTLLMAALACGALVFVLALVI